MPGNVTEDRIPMVFYEIRHRAETGACCNLRVTDVVLPTDLGYLALALHVEACRRRSLAASTVWRTREQVRQGFHKPNENTTHTL